MNTDHHQDHIEISPHNPNVCTPMHFCHGHEKGHMHGANCGHEAVPHGDHTDYLVDGHLHHQHGNHCDNHGTIEVQ